MLFDPKERWLLGDNISPELRYNMDSVNAFMGN